MSRKIRLHDALTAELNPMILNIEDESHLHRRQGIETHFKVIIVSARFEGLKLLQRHQKVNKLAAKEFKTGLHALSLHLYTPEEWEKRGASTPQTPACQHVLRS